MNSALTNSSSVFRGSEIIPDKFPNYHLLPHLAEEHPRKFPQQHEVNHKHFLFLFSPKRLQNPALILHFNTTPRVCRELITCWFGRLREKTAKGNREVAR
jgi:hypothetical protein